MSVQSKARMSVDEFLAWAETQPGKYELVDGVLLAMSPQRATHVHVALRQAIESAGIGCEAFPDGIAVQVDNQTFFELDALVQCGERLNSDAITATSPVIVVDVLSPSELQRARSLRATSGFRAFSITSSSVQTGPWSSIISAGRAT